MSSVVFNSMNQVDLILLSLKSGARRYRALAIQFEQLKKKLGEEGFLRSALSKLYLVPRKLE